MVIQKNLDSWVYNCSNQQQPNNFYGSNQQPNHQQPAYLPQPSYPTYHVLQPPNAYYAPQQVPQNVEWVLICANDLANSTLDFLFQRNTFDMRKANLKSIQTCRQRRGSFPMREKESALVAKSLNLTRQNLQAVMNREIDLVINRYIEVRI